MLLDLLPELLERVLCHCRADDLKNLSQCCDDLKNICRAALWRTVRIPPQELVNDTFALDYRLPFLTLTKVLRIHGFPGMVRELEVHKRRVLHNIDVLLETTALHVLDTWFLSEGFAQLCQPNCIEEVRLCKYAAKNSLLIETCNNFPSLKVLELEVEGLGIDNDGMLHIRKLERLERLCVGKSSLITDACVEHISSLARLKELKLWAYNVTDAGLYHLGKLQHLQKLEIAQCNGIRDTGLSYLKELPLTEISLSYCPFVTDKGIQHLMVKGLRKLHLTSIRELSADVFRHIGSQVSLRDVKLNSCIPYMGPHRDPHTLLHFRHVSSLAHVQKVDFSSSWWINETTMLYVAKLTSLKELYLNKCGFLNDEALKFLNSLILLQVLDIGNCQHVSDEGMIYVSWLKQLGELDISHCEGITDSGAQNLVNLKNLRKLNILKCPGITMEFSNVSSVLKGE